MTKNLKIKFNSDYELHLNKTIEIATIIVVRTTFHRNGKYYSQSSIDESLYKLWII